MKTLTVRRVDEKLDEGLKRMAAERGLSVNELILKALSAFTGLNKPSRFPVYHDLDSLAGGWDASEERNFNRKISSLSDVDKEMWQ